MGGGIEGWSGVDEKCLGNLALRLQPAVVSA